MESAQEAQRISGQTRTAVASAPKAAHLTVDKRYPVLFSPGETSVRPGYYRKERPGTRLIVITARHDALTTEEIEAIAQYRLVQYTLAGLYDAEIVTRLQLKADPAIGTLSSQDIHVLVGDISGRFLCYMCFQSAIAPPPPWLSSVPTWIAETAGAPSDYPLVQHTNRPYFPVESEYGPMIYAQHPGLQLLPIAGIRELTRLVRNQLTRTPVDALAVVEAILAVSEAMRDPSYRIEAIVGCASFEVRRLLWTLGIRMAYAPLAPIQGDNVSGQIPGAELLWTEEAHLPGRFWPIAITTPDVLADADEFARLDAALALLDVAEVGAQVKRLRREGPRAQPRLVVPSDEAGGILWTADAFYPIEMSEPNDSASSRLKPA